MRVSANWLRHFVDPDRTLDEIAEALTTAGLEVDDIEHWTPAFEGVCVAHVVAVEPHPNRGDARVCRVATDESDSSRPVVCTASNVKTGMRAPFAAPGARLGHDNEIETAEIAGVESHGMLCSAAELGVGSDDSGVWHLPDDAPPGTDLAVYLELPDDILVLDLTPNRGDCLGMLGVARETALTCNRDPLQICSSKLVSSVPAASRATRGVSISAPDACAIYLARGIGDMDASAATPPWLSERLRRAGIGTVSAPVDITNYVMLALGQPMHAFDADALVGAIDVRYARPGETFITLEDTEVTLDAETLVIADERGPVAMAGVIGGLRTAVTADTTNIVFEAACFSPATVAGEGRRYKIHTDSLHRFERGVDPAMAAPAIEYATELCQQIAGGKPGPVARADGTAFDAYRPAITLRAADIERTLGQAIEPAFVTRTLEALGLDVTHRDDATWSAIPPSWRFDLAIAADLIEEIARVYGYERIATSEGQVALAEPVNRLAEPRAPLWLLRARGYSEAITYSFVDPEIQARLLGEQNTLALDNPIADTMAVMRRSLLPGLIQAYVYNLRRHHRDVRLYERGLCFEPDQDAENGVAQVDRIAGLIAGHTEPPHWNDTSRELDFFDIKGDVEALFHAAGRSGVTFEPARHEGLEPGRTASIHWGAACVGWLGQLEKSVIKGNKNNILPYIFEVESRYMVPSASIRHTAVSDQPIVTRDLALVVADEMPAARLISTVWSADPPALQEVEVVDVFHGGNLESGFKSVALRLIFQDKTSTLVAEEVDNVVAGLTATLATDCGAQLRGT